MQRTYCKQRTAAAGQIMRGAHRSSHRQVNHGYGQYINHPLFLLHMGSSEPDSHTSHTSRWMQSQQSKTLSRIASRNQSDTAALDEVLFFLHKEPHSLRDPDEDPKQHKLNPHAIIITQQRSYPETTQQSVQIGGIYHNNAQQPKHLTKRPGR